MNKYVLIGVLVVAVVGGLWFPRPKAPLPAPAPAPVPYGSITGPDANSPYFVWGGVQHWAVNKTLGLATTTPCSLPSPASTSTLVRVGFQVTTATSTAVTIRVATSSNAFASTTLYFSHSLASGAQGSFWYSPTTTAAAVMAPNTYLNQTVEGFIGADSTKFLGSCSAEWAVL